MGEVVSLEKYSRLTRAVSRYRAAPSKIAKDVILVPFGPEDREQIIKAANLFSQFAARSQLVWFATMCELATLTIFPWTDLSSLGPRA